MPINFNNASLLAYDHQHRFFGDGLFRYGVTKNLTVEGYVLDLTNTTGISGVLRGINDIKVGATDFEPIVLNGVNFGNGRVNSISFDQGIWVRSTKYSANIEIFESGNIYNLTGAYYNDVTGLFRESAVNLKFLNELSENFSFSQSKNGIVDVNHSLNVQFISGDDNVNPITRARYLAKNLFLSGTLTGLQGGLVASGLLYNFFLSQNILPSGSYFFNKRYYTENYDLFSRVCQFSERYSIDPNNRNYSFLTNYSINTDIDGITNVSENGNIKGLISPIFTTALSGYRDVITGAFSRCSGIYSRIGPTGINLINSPIENGSIQNKFDGTIDYTIKFSNDPRIYSGYIWEYTTSLDRNEEIINVSERGKIVGRGILGSNEKYNNALTGFNIIYPNINSRITSRYNSVVIPAKTLRQISSSNSRGRYKGIITYDYQFSDDPSIIIDGQVNKKTIQVSDAKPTYIYGNFVIFNNREILQNGGNTNLGAETINITYNYKRTSSPDIDSLFTRFKSEVQSFLSQYVEGWVSDCEFTIDEINNSFNAIATINYVQTRAQGDLSLNW